MKTKLVISIPSLWSLRNFIYSDIIASLEDKFELYFLTLKNSEIENTIKKKGLKTIYYNVSPNNTIQKSILQSITKKYIRNNIRLKKSKLINIKIKPAKGLIGLIVSQLEYLFSIFPDKLLLYLYKLNIKYTIDPIFETLVNKELHILATNFVIKHEMDVFLIINKFHCKKINFINSFDNTTSRGYLPFEIFDYHIVWNNQMKEEIHQIFNIDKAKISTLGTPQFDLLVEGSNTNIHKTDPIYEIVEKKEYILYCAGHYSLLPFEVEIVQNLIQNLNKDSKNRTILIVRLHPLDDNERWNKVAKLDSNTYIDIPWKQDSNNPLVSVPNRYEYIRHGRLINNALFILNIGSTSTLDACVLDRPVYNLFFKEYNNNGQLDTIYNSEHFSPIIKSGAAPLLYSIDEIELLIKKRSYQSEELRTKRKMLAEYYCGYNSVDQFRNRFRRYIESL